MRNRDTRLEPAHGRRPFQVVEGAKQTGQQARIPGRLPEPAYGLLDLRGLPMQIVEVFLQQLRIDLFGFGRRFRHRQVPPSFPHCFCG
jgi:hypothetical protein